MDPRLLTLYEQELRYFRESTGVHGEHAHICDRCAAALA